jgi:hypothetical protein
VGFSKFICKTDLAGVRTQEPLNKSAVFYPKPQGVFFKLVHFLNERGSIYEYFIRKSITKPTVTFIS